MGIGSNLATFWETINTNHYGNLMIKFFVGGHLAIVLGIAAGVVGSFGPAFAFLILGVPMTIGFWLAYYIFRERQRTAAGNGRPRQT